jgi:hypothetical protein
MRRWLGLLGAIGLLASSVGGAAAGAATKSTDVYRDAGCGPLDSPNGVVYFSMFISSLNGTDAFFDVYDPVTDDVILTRDFDREATVSITDTSVSATIPVLPAGSAIVTASRTVIEPFSYDDSFRDGNQWFRQSTTGTAYALEGSLTMPGASGSIAFGAESCSSTDATATSFNTNPHSHVASFSGSGGVCDLFNDAGDELQLFMDLTDGNVFIDSTVIDAGGSRIGAVGDGTLGADGTAALTLGEYDPDTFESTGGSATVTLSAQDTGETTAYVTKYTNQVFRTTASVIDIEGSFVGSLGSFDLGPCVAAATRTKLIANGSNGPKPSGKAPANDKPAGAVSLKPGAKATLATKGASVASEAPYDCMTFADGEGGTFTVPVEFTVWYKVAGTGSPITVDTAGSDYDMVGAGYTGTPGAFTTVGCVDDQRFDPIGQNTQAWVTVPTSVGTTYWVQIGGLDEIDFRTGVRSLPYGTLKVAVR